MRNYEKNSKCPLCTGKNIKIASQNATLIDQYDGCVFVIDKQRSREYALNFKYCLICGRKYP